MSSKGLWKTASKAVAPSRIHSHCRDRQKNPPKTENKR